MDKICCKCGLELGSENFPKAKNTCKFCLRIYQNEYKLKNKDKLNIYQAEWRSKNPDKVKASNARYCETHKKESTDRVKTQKLKHYHSNRDYYVAKQREYRRLYPDKARESSRLWWQKNTSKVVAKAQRRRATKLNRTPVWANDFFVQEVYHLAKIRSEITNIKWHVDHIVPLNSELVCGFHSEHNLQVITWKENLSKSNRHWPDMWE